MIKSLSLINLNLYLILYLTIIFMMLIFFSPIILISLLVFYSTMICLNLSLWSMNYLYSIILFLIMISGMLIIFMYFASILSNEQVKNIMNMKPLIFMSILVLLLIFTLTQPYSPPYMFYPHNETIQFYTMNPTLHNNLINLFCPPFYNMSLLCMIFLMFTLFMIIKICSSSSSPLRKISK